MTDKLAFVFPGQGSQQVGMIADYLSEPVVQATFAEAAGVLGFDLLNMVSEGPAEALNQTENTQPALLVSSVALWRLWCERQGEAPSMMAGHSLGEYSALVCAGAMNFTDAVSLVRLRGLFMQEAVASGAGAMAAIIGLDDADVVAACEKAAGDEVVEAVNFNAPGQVVIAGQVAAVKRAIECAKEAGAKRAIELPVSVPSHCALMKPAAERLQKALDGIELIEPVIPVVQNVSANVCSDPAQLKANLVAQLYSPVRWVESVETMMAAGVGRFAECGPGKVLAGLNKRIARRAPIATLESADAMAQMLAEANQ
ncbi:MULTISPECIES: ACP S-malonyltransferase [Gammaproteobacteria]|uniref:ACP S-malonyltransferase n=1 Tax=Gammaproteobacteria TaxID=1236 RepID=UPI001ADBE3C3|nr:MULTISPECIES: ACP S-malonyltransferase [Gammaproteobacteria]MBO9480903.1 ACP S-malonyltransferase [Salinisphaera sp. G21_0]MBO9494557.1 ACP S-malonyltransferase [Thalassotalea sp. G20_0]